MKLVQFTRYSEWWEYKLIPLLSIAYATILFYGENIEKVGFQLIIILFAVIFGAIYVSIINDLTDIVEDLSVGKKNRMANISTFSKTFLIVASILIGIIFGYVIFPDKISLVFFVLSYLVFTAYSLPPVRLKKRGFWGVLCDASGAHLFPSLLIASNIAFVNNDERNLIWMLSIGFWALFYGLRGILFHQFYDRENDLKSGTTTFAAGITPSNFRYAELFIFTAEAIGIGFIILKIINIWIIIALMIYLILLLGRSYLLKYKICLIILEKDKPSQLLMNDFYMVFMPLSILFSIALNNRYGWVAILIHITLFPQHILIAIKDFFLIVKKVLLKI